jgi:hypothetical protein
MNSMAKPSSIWRTTRPCVLPTVYDDADGRAEIRRYTDGGTRLRKIDHPARDIRAIWQDQPRHRLSRGEAVMTAIFRQVEDLPETISVWPSVLVYR